MTRVITTTIAAVIAAVAMSASGSAWAFKACTVTDTGVVDDKGFNQYTWQGVKDAAKEGGFASPYFTTSTESLVPGTGTVPGTVAKTWVNFGSSVTLTPAALCGAQPGKC